ncbi:WYL domain-containing protein [Vibrio sp. R78045]|uniref:WYL domain-containing protein n=1 Tax=Vibrio sp. R78045 TaxID=3093868 RepID=UPI0036F26174
MKKALADKTAFDEYVKRQNYNLEEQKELCTRFGLNHQIGTRSYDSVEDWKKELTIVWAGETSDIEFTYRKYDERERRNISPTEFGFDGNKKAYIRGVCHQSNEARTFKTARIETKIKVGSKRFNLIDWLDNELDIDVNDLVGNLEVKL